MMKTAPHGQRKLTHAREMALILTLGFGVAAYLEVPAELFASYALGMSTLSGAFVWGNIRENQAKANSLNAPITPATPHA